MPAGRPRGVTKKHKVKDVNKPKRAATAYFCYLGHCRQKEQEAGRKITNVSSFTKQVAEKWRGLSDNDRKTFDDLSLKDKKRYEEEMKLYKGPSVVKDEGKPKRAQSSYFFFLPGFRKTLDGTKYSHTEKVKKAGEKWRSMTDEEKAPYEAMAREDQARYEAAVQVWRKSNNAKQQAQQNNSAADDEEDDDEDDEEDDDDEDDDDDDDDDE